MKAASCLAPLPWETLVDYWAGELAGDEVDAVEEHLFGCAECSASSARIAAIAGGVRSLLPPFLARADVEALRARGLRVEENPCAAGERHEAVFARDLDVLLHRLGGLELADAVSVDVQIAAESSGEVLVDAKGVPFERAEGAVLVACQRHFAALPPDIVFDVHVRDGAGARRTSRFAVPHRFVP